MAIVVCSVCVLWSVHIIIMDLMTIQVPHVHVLTHETLFPNPLQSIPVLSQFRVSYVSIIDIVFYVHVTGV